MVAARVARETGVEEEEEEEEEQREREREREARVISRAASSRRKTKADARPNARTL